MFDASALWIAAKYESPMLIAMYNNRAYYNDWEHQVRMARVRGTDPDKAHIGMDLFGPAPDFGGARPLDGRVGRGTDRGPGPAPPGVAARPGGGPRRSARFGRRRHPAPLKPT